MLLTVVLQQMVGERCSIKTDQCAIFAENTKLALSFFGVPRLAGSPDRAQGGHLHQ